MPRYTVTQRYGSYRDGVRYGPYAKGDTVELTEPEAEWINRDAPGTLAEEAAAKPKTAEPDGKTGPNRAHKPAANRGGK